jgi:phage shock protein C
MVPGRSGGDHDAMDIRDDTATTDTTDTTARSAAPRLIKRSKDDRIFGGVCGGIARHLDIDPVIVRIATVALVCAVGAGAVAYVAAWILMPLDEEPSTPLPTVPRPMAA